MAKRQTTLLILPRSKAEALGARLDAIEAELARSGRVIREVADTLSARAVSVDVLTDVDVEGDR